MRKMGNLRKVFRGFIRSPSVKTRMETSVTTS